MSPHDQKHRSHLPMPNTGKKGLITFDAKDPASKFPPIERSPPVFREARLYYIV